MAAIPAEQYGMSLIRARNFTGGNVTRPRAADDFATIRARMEELRRERAQAPEEPQDSGRSPSAGRSLLKAPEARQRGETDRWPAGSTAGRRYASGR